jgi:hypothetical protein
MTCIDWTVVHVTNYRNRYSVERLRGDWYFETKESMKERKEHLAFDS